MSGFERDHNGHTHFALTATKANYWHGCRGARNGPGFGDCDHGISPREIVEAHTDAAEFQVIFDGGGYCHVWGPGLGPKADELKTCYLFAALSGWPLDDISDR